jgi:glycerophosphoryl diester phosphodiesterase
MRSYFLIGLFSLVLVQCTILKPKASPMTPKFDKQGHRGCRGLMPENTIPAMLKALSSGVSTLEMDAVITADSQIILSHEPFFNHEITTKPDGDFVTQTEERQYNIYHMTYAETMRFDVGLKPNPRFPRQQKLAVHKPLLGDVIDSVERFIKEHNLPLPFYNIETKTQPQTDGLYHPAPDAFIELLAPLLIEKGIAERVIIQSFDIRTLQYLHQHHPGFKTALLVEDTDKRTLQSQITALGFLPTIYSPHYSLVDHKLITDCHLQQIRIIPWTVNESREIKRLKAMGVDGVISDYPDLFD